MKKPRAQRYDELWRCAVRLLHGVRERHPGEELQCPDMISLDKAVEQSRKDILKFSAKEFSDKLEKAGR